MTPCPRSIWQSSYCEEEEFDEELDGWRSSCALEDEAELLRDDLADEFSDEALDGCRNSSSLEDEAALRDDAALLNDEVLWAEVVDEEELGGDESGEDLGRFVAGLDTGLGGCVAAGAAAGEAGAAGACPFDSVKLRRAVTNKLSTAVVIGLSIVLPFALVEAG